MKIEPFKMERVLNQWENVVDIDVSGSVGHITTLQDLVSMGFDLDASVDIPLTYCQGNGSVELRELLSQYYPGTTGENILVTTGTCEANYLVARTLVENGDEIAIQMPNYLQMRGVFPSLGGKLNTFALKSEKGWETRWDEFERAVNKNTRLVYLSNPNNPSGMVLSAEAMKRIVERCEETDTWLLADEIFIGSEVDGSETTSFWKMSDKVIVTNGLSKSYGLPGLRIGWVVANAKLTAEFWSQRDYTTLAPAKLSDAIACVAVKRENREKLFNRTRDLIRQNLGIVREWAATFDGRLGLTEPKSGAFCLLHFDADLSSEVLAGRIRENQSTLIVPGEHCGLEKCFRVALGASDKLREGLERVGVELRQIFGSEHLT